jgi:diamine N-acetyltransferase
MHGEARITPCGPDQVDALSEVGRETYDETFGPMNTRETMDAYLAEAFAREKLLGELRDPGCRFFFLHVDGELAGYLKVNEAPAQSDVNDPASLEIERIYVRARFKGRGLGRTLMEHALGLARQAGKTYAWLGVWERNADAIAFYGRMGFTEAGRHSFRMGDEIQSDLIMRRELG